MLSFSNICIVIATLVIIIIIIIIVINTNTNTNCNKSNFQIFPSLVSSNNNSISCPMGPISCSCASGSISYAWDPTIFSNSAGQIGPTGPYYAIEYPGCPYGVNPQGHTGGTDYTCALPSNPSYNAVQCLSYMGNGTSLIPSTSPVVSQSISCQNLYNPMSCGCDDESNLSYAWEQSIVSKPTTGPDYDINTYSIIYPGCEYGVDSQGTIDTINYYTCATESAPTFNAVQCISA